ncbi:MAG: hypothetical protein EAZ97_09325 [Bacteroidetes bacterium]|nr:MAG: hypothetical protein EAZ97_09325 [Bacteroidota bacterium]
MEKIGEILLDSGVLLLGDLIQLKKIKQSVHNAKKLFLHTKTQKTYTQGVDFNKFTDVLLDNKTVNELLADASLQELSTQNPHELSSENILKDLEKGFKQIDFENGTEGKAFAVLLRESSFQIYAQIGEKGIEKLMIDFTKKSL